MYQRCNFPPRRIHRGRMVTTEPLHSAERTTLLSSLHTMPPPTHPLALFATSYDVVVIVFNRINKKKLVRISLWALNKKQFVISLCFQAF